MKTPAIIIFLFLILIGNAQIESTLDTSSFAHLTEVNKEWKAHKSLSTEQNISFANDADRIQFHLFSVAQILKQRSTSHLSQKQKIQRMALLDTLMDYAQLKVFPTNTGHLKRTPYFIDAKDVHCAVGYLMKKSGNDALAQQIRSEYNYDYLRNIKTVGVSKWAEGHGFELDELAWIQPGYELMNGPGLQSLGGGTNGVVRQMAMDEKHDRLFIIGDFDSLSKNIACSQFAYYQFDMLHCIGENLKGTLTDLAISNGKVFVSGQLEVSGGVYSLGIYENDSLRYLNIPSREGFLSTTVFVESDSNEIELIIENGQHSEIWHYNGSWTLIASVHGKINSIARGAESIIYGGTFDGFTTMHKSSIVILQANNIIKRSLTDTKWSAVQGQIAEEVLKVKWRENNFFFSGRDSEGFAFGMIDENAAVAFNSPWLYADPYAKSNEITIHDFELSSDSAFTIVGEFYAGLQYETYNQATFSYRGYKQKRADAESSLFLPISGTMTYEQNEIPYCILVHNYTAYTGGSFSRWGNINYIDQRSHALQVRKRRLDEVRHKLTSELLILEGAQVNKITIYDAHWNYIKKGRGNQIKLKNCPSGLCYADLVLDSGKRRTLTFWHSGN